jgi:hypothetical protein
MDMSYLAVISTGLAASKLLHGSLIAKLECCRASARSSGQPGASDGRCGPWPTNQEVGHASFANPCGPWVRSDDQLPLLVRANRPPGPAPG